jgi:hypothetical protein
MMEANPKTIPAAPLLLTLGGLTPFIVSGAIAAVTPDPILRAQAHVFLLAYAAVIMSFLGGARWGAEVATTPLSPPSAGVLTASVIPSLIGWGLVVYGVLQGFNGWLFGGAAAVLLVQYVWDAAPSKALPAWYPRLRLIATIGACASLIAAALPNLLA